MSGVTVVVEDKGSEEIIGGVIESSRKLYAKEVVKGSASVSAKISSKSKGTQSADKQSDSLKTKTSLK